MKNKDFENIMLNRKSIKVFDENTKIERSEMLEMINKAVSAPSSINMQPWRFVVVDTPKGKSMLEPLVMFNTRQNQTSSAMVVLFWDMKCYEKAETILDNTLEKGLINKEMKEQFLSSYVPMYENMPKEAMNDIVKVDTSLAAMQLMLVARYHGYETNPIGGFDREKIAEVLGLDTERYVPVMIIAIGKQNYKPHDTIRLDAQDITTFL